MSKIPNIFAFAAIDRAAHRRTEPGGYETAWRNGTARTMLVCNGEIVISGPDSAPALAWLVEPPAGATIVFLGIENGIMLFASLTETPVALPADSRLVNLRQVGAFLPAAEAGLAVYALGLARWHERHHYCGVCGHALLTVDGGHRKTCANCQADHFPRTDPAVIVLVTRGDRCLLAHNAKYPPGRHSTLAGFVEPGESLEMTVAREVFEEVGVRVTGICYHSSQPWPFPASLMLGFYAEAVNDDLQPDGIEIVSAGWFSPADIRARMATPGDDFSLPAPLSISRRLIDEWLAAK